MMTYRNSPMEDPEVPVREPWREDASCRGHDLSLFFPDEGDLDGIERAKEICADCPVKDLCLSYAVETNQTEGIWGGATKQERRRLRRRWLKDLREAS